MSGMGIMWEILGENMAGDFGGRFWQDNLTGDSATRKGVWPRNYLIPGPHILAFSGGQDAYRQRMGAIQAHTRRILQLPGPHLFTLLAGCRREAHGRQSGCAQSATVRILTHFTQICIKIYVN